MSDEEATERSADQQPSPEWSAQVEELYRSQGRELWGRFYALCSDAERSYDAVQEAFTRLHQQLQKKNGAEIRDMRAWLLRVGQNWLRDVARRKSNSTKSTEHLDLFASDSQDPATLAVNDELHGQVREALSQLKEEDREVLVLRYAMNWSSQRIAETLMITASAVDMRLSRARRRFAELLEKTGVDHDYT